MTFTIEGKYTTATVYAQSLGPSCAGQITDMVNHPALTAPVAIMPDAHAGAGAVIGFTMPMTDKIIPHIIGVDIGCGVLALNLGPIDVMDFAGLDRQIREAVPFGFHINPHPMMDAFPWNDANRSWDTFQDRSDDGLLMPVYSPEWFEATAKRVNCARERAFNAPGSLGGGNHFIEFDRNPATGDVWLVIHSGSRKFGMQVAKYWQDRAVQYHKGERRAAHMAEVAIVKRTCAPIDREDALARIKTWYAMPPKSMEWLDRPDHVRGYLHDMMFAQQYASYSRWIMAGTVLDIMGAKPVHELECVHNFIDPVDMVIRKGAIRAAKGQRCFVPLNMRDGALLGVGKGNEAWNTSAPHGAGRTMSRRQAKRELSLDDFKAQMADAGVWSSSICKGTLDEAPGAYKDWEQIFDAVGDTMEVQAHLKPIFNMKAV